MGVTEDILKKLTVKEIGHHLRNYSDLYVRPLYVWRQIMSNRTGSYNLTILHTIYYLLFVSLSLDRPLELLVFYVLVEVAITVIPLLIFLIPFVVLTKMFKKRISWNRLFRLFLILKLQFFPILIVLILIAKWGNVEGPYIIFDNLVSMLWLTLIVLPPLIIKLRIWQKMIWVVSNYIIFMVFIISIAFVAEQIKDVGLLFDKISNITPSGEYNSYLLKSSNSEMFINDWHYLLIIQRNSNGSIKSVQPQFVTNQLLKQFEFTYRNQTNGRLKKIDSLKMITDTEMILTKTSIDSLKVHPKESELNYQQLSSMKKQFSKQLYEDIKLIGTLKDSATYESNREYFKALHEYLLVYERPYIDVEFFFQVRNKKKEPEPIYLNINNVAFLYEIDSTYNLSTKIKYSTLNERLGDRQFKSSFVETKLLYPVEIFLNIFGYYDE